MGEGSKDRDTGGECKIGLKKAEINTRYKQLEDSLIQLCTTTMYVNNYIVCQPPRRHRLEP